MGKKLPTDQMKLYKRIDEILFKEWDPIGVSDFDGPSDEYQGYLPQVFRRALENDNPAPIAEYLTLVTTESMGMSAAKEYDLKIAKLILLAKKECLGSSENHS